MGTIFGAVFCVAMLLVVVITSRMKKKALQKIYEQYHEKDFAYTLVFGSYDWGPGTDKIILNTGKSTENFSDENLSASNFKVTVKSELYNPETDKVEEKEKILTVKRAYLCDIDGNEITKSTEDSDEEIPDDEAGSATHIALEIEVSPDNPFTSPFTCDPKTKHNVWKKIYDFKISHPLFENDMSECSDWFSPDAQKFRSVKTSGSLKAASFTPDNAKDKNLHPLIVWLHGSGEGGEDTNITLLGNKVTALGGEKIQSYFDGAFVLCPQTKTCWMQNGDTPYDILSDATVDKSSRYTTECKKIIDGFIKKNPQIDRRRIYIGGCSSGGYMAMNMVMRYPNFFAAAFPVCEAYQDRWIGTEDFENLKKTPLWFVVAKDDQRVPPEHHTLPTFKRLSESGSKSVRMSCFDSIKDTSGKYFDPNGNPYGYKDHCSWIPLFNDECSSEDGQKLWDWISKQKS